MSTGEILRSHRIWILCGFFLFAAYLILKVWVPNEEPAKSICFIRQTTGISCPGCGLSRGFAALAKWDLGGALQKHPLSPIFAFEALCVWTYWGILLAGWVRPPSVDFIHRALFLQVALLLFVWSFRLVSRTLV
jgi:hypothetical protein